MDFVEEVHTLCKFQDKENILQIREWGHLKKGIFSKPKLSIVMELASFNVVDYLKNKLPEDRHALLKQRIDIADINKKEESLGKYEDLIIEDTLADLIDLKILFVEAVINAVKQMHLYNYIHQDLKWNNVLVFESSDTLLSKNSIKLGDFGSSQAGTETSCSLGAVATFPPEYFNLKDFRKKFDGKKADIFSLGMMIVQMFDYIQYNQNLRVKIFQVIAENPSERPDIDGVSKIFQEIKTIIKKH